MERDLFYGSYVQTYLQRDVRDLARVGDEMAFLRFLRAAAARTGQLMNLADLARDADVAPNTAKNWLSILQTAEIVYLLQPYHTNLNKRLVKTPKLYFLDTGLAAYLTEWASPETLEAGAMSGSILETWIVAELLKSYWHNGRQPPLYYYRDRDQKEIDLLLVQDGIVYPLELKKTASPSRDDVRHFGALEGLGLPVGPGGVICLAEQALPLTPSTQSIPVLDPPNLLASSPLDSCDSRLLPTSPLMTPDSRLADFPPPPPPPHRLHRRLRQPGRRAGCQPSARPLVRQLHPGLGESHRPDLALPLARILDRG